MPEITVAQKTDSSFLLPRPITAMGDDAIRAFIEFFTAQIRNANTREAYLRNIRRFLDWTMSEVSQLEQIEPFHVGAYIEMMEQGGYAKATVKQHLASIRLFGSFLVIRQVLPRNPALEVRGPKHVVRTGLTPAFERDDAKRLFASIDPETVAGRRDRALFAVLLYSLGRISAVLGLDVGDYYQVGRSMKLRYKEKGGVQHEMPAHHTAIEYLDAYLAELAPESGPLFRSINRTRTGYTQNRLDRREALAMVKRRCRQAGLGEKFSNHSFRATGITIYLKNGGDLEKAQHMAAHASIKTTKLYDRRDQEASLDEVEKIIL